MNMTKHYRFDKFKFMDILPKELGYFLELAQQLSVSKAAETLGIQQSGLSRALLRLEGEIGQPLFVRKNTGLAITPAGDRLLTAVKKTMQTWEAELEKASESSEVPNGLLKMGFHSSLGQVYFAKILSLLTKRFPNLELEIHTTNSIQVARKVNDLEIDIGLVATTVRAADLVLKKIGTDYIACYQNKNSDSPKRILFNPDMQLSNSILKKYSALKKVFIKDYNLIASACSEPGYMGILPFSVAQNYPHLQQVGGIHLKADVNCVIHTSKYRSNSYRQLFECITEACRKSD